MFYFLYKLVAILPCQHFGGRHNGFIRDCFARTRLMRVVRVNQNNKVVGQQTKTMSSKMLKHYVELREATGLGVNSVVIHHCVQNLSHYTQ